MKRTGMTLVLILAAVTLFVGPAEAQTKPRLPSLTPVPPMTEGAIGPILTGPEYEVILLSPGTMSTACGIGVPPGAGKIYITGFGGIGAYSSGTVDLVAAAPGFVGARYLSGYGLRIGGSDKIYKLIASQPTIKQLATVPGATQIWGVEIDPADGSIFFAAMSGSAAGIYRLPKGSRSPKLLVSLPFWVYGLGLYGNYLYIPDYGGTIYRMPKKGGNLVAFLSGFSGPTGIAADAGGNLYIAEFLSGNISAVKSGTTTPVRIATGFFTPVAIGVNAEGNVYFVENYGGRLWELRRHFE